METFFCVDVKVNKKAKEREMEAVARKGMDKDEASFAVEAPLEAQTFLWSEKYRPRKPRKISCETGIQDVISLNIKILFIGVVSAETKRLLMQEVKRT
uniref:Uncharacterized protein n=1 Tax=Ascaris lumbricoides TaxID=6252 RepID=A0A0M3HJX1_ASCLU